MSGSTPPLSDDAQRHTTSVKEADYLEQDPVIRGQRFACISFVSPGDAIAAKEAYAARRFLSSVAKDLSTTLDNLLEMFGKSTPSVRDTVHMLRERHGYLWDEGAAQLEYTIFLQQEAEALDRDFVAEHDKFRTNVHGVKIRGVFDSFDEATNRAKAVKRFDDKFNVFVCEVGCWCPWSPSPDAIQNAEYAETQLNTLMKKYNEGQQSRDELYSTRKDASIERMGQERETWLERLKAEVAARKMVEEEVERRAAAEAIAPGAGEIEKDDGVGEVTKDDGVGEVTKDDGVGEVTKDDGVGEVTKDDGVGEVTKDDGAGEVTKDDGLI